VDFLDYIETAAGVWVPAREPGVYPDETDGEYAASKGVRKSQLDDIAPERDMTPAHFWDKHVNPNQDPPKVKDDALILGDAIHKAILQPDLMSQFAFVPEDAPARPTDAMRNSKSPSVSSQDRVSWWDDFERENHGKRILPVKMHRAIEGARDAVHCHPVAKHLFTGGQSEQSFYAVDPQTGALIKCRVDYNRLERDGMLIDLKTCEDASPRGFKASTRAYRYDVQDPWYQHVIHSAWGAKPGEIVRKFVFTMVEKLRPFALGIYWIDPADRQNGMDMAHRDLATILDCRRSQLWPDFGCTPQGVQINRRSYT
jgi:hypothetical protein